MVLSLAPGYRRLPSRPAPYQLRVRGLMSRVALDTSLQADVTVVAGSPSARCCWGELLSCDLRCLLQPLWWRKLKKQSCIVFCLFLFFSAPIDLCPLSAQSEKATITIGQMAELSHGQRQKHFRCIVNVQSSLMFGVWRGALGFVSSTLNDLSNR